MCACGRLIVCVHIAEMIKWSTQHYRQDQRMKVKPCSTCVPNAGCLVLCYLLTDYNTVQYNTIQYLYL